jgi:hypothetical protein
MRRQGVAVIRQSADRFEDLRAPRGFAPLGFGLGVNRRDGLRALLQFAERNTIQIFDELAGGR